jgi:hypothetical protein
MKSENFVKHAAAVFILALAIYILAYSAIEHYRSHNGPWRVAFTNDASGAPTMLIAQPALTITNVQLVFAGAVLPVTNTLPALALEQPRPVPFEVPFGRCVFLDLTSLPGTAAFNVFGHEVQLLPRVLTIDKVEHSWRSDAVYTLPPVGSSSETNRP